MKGRLLHLNTLVIIGLIVASCSSRTTQTKVQGPWDPALAQFFDDAADFIENPGDLQGTWATDYLSMLQGLVDNSDLICRVHITTINEDISVDGHRRKHLLARVTSVLQGEAPEDNWLHLNVDENIAGFDTVERSERRLFNKRFIAFVRWYKDENNKLKAHWHLSPESTAVLQFIRRSIDDKEKNQG